MPKVVVITGIFVRQVEGDRVVQEWQTTDLLGCLAQMGFTKLLGYTVAAGLLKMRAPPPPRRFA
jgi:hypothetical protein